MRILVSLSMAMAIALVSCNKGDGYSSDIDDSSQLPNRGDYLDEDYGTQVLAQEMVEAYSTPKNDSCLINLVVYDEETRTQPLLTFTGNSWPIKLEALESGAVGFSFEDFQTEMMPLKMNTDIKVLLDLNSTQDTIYLNGTDGKVRTELTEGQPIGTPLPESDDAELEGYYVRRSQKLYILFDLMLPIAIKAHIQRKRINDKKGKRI